MDAEKGADEDGSCDEHQREHRPAVVLCDDEDDGRHEGKGHAGDAELIAALSSPLVGEAGEREDEQNGRTKVGHRFEAAQVIEHHGAGIKREIEDAHVTQSSSRTSSAFGQ